VFSLYVFPDHRSTGVAYRGLRAVHSAASSAGFAGIRVSTFWTSRAAPSRSRSPSTAAAASRRR
jgi:hypothetical protein